MAIVSVPRGIQLISAWAINEKCSREGKSLILFQLGQIQKRWDFMATVRERRVYVYVLCKEEHWLQVLQRPVSSSKALGWPLASLRWSGNHLNWTCHKQGTFWELKGQEQWEWEMAKSLGRHLLHHDFLKAWCLLSPSILCNLHGVASHRKKHILHGECFTIRADIISVWYLNTLNIYKTNCLYKGSLGKLTLLNIYLSSL